MALLRFTTVSLCLLALFALPAAARSAPVPQVAVDQAAGERVTVRWSAAMRVHGAARARVAFDVRAGRGVWPSGRSVGGRGPRPCGSSSPAPPRSRTCAISARAGPCGARTGAPPAAPRRVEARAQGAARGPGAAATGDETAPAAPVPAPAEPAAERPRPPTTGPTRPPTDTPERVGVARLADRALARGADAVRRALALAPAVARVPRHGRRPRACATPSASTSTWSRERGRARGAAARRSGFRRARVEFGWDSMRLRRPSACSRDPRQVRARCSARCAATASGRCCC